MSALSPGARVILKELGRQKSAPARQIARQLYARHPEMWLNAEACRGQIRYFLGQAGDNGRKSLSIRDYIREARGAGQQAEIPPSDAVERTPFVIRESRIGIISDIHLPYHSVDEIEVAVAAIKHEQPDCLLLNGDMVDCYRISHWQKDPTRRAMRDELILLAEFLQYLRDQFPKIPIYYKQGNHEKRLDDYMIVKAPELLDVAEWQLERVLPFDDMGITVVEQDQLIYAGKLTIIHGHEFPTPVIGPVNAARGLQLRAADSALVSHHHQSSEHIWPTIRGKTLGTWSIGCLCDKWPDYARLNRWCHGFATVEVESSGAFEVNNRKIIDGKVR